MVEDPLAASRDAAWVPRAWIQVPYWLGVSTQTSSLSQFSGTICRASRVSMICLLILLRAAQGIYKKEPLKKQGSPLFPYKWIITIVTIGESGWRWHCGNQVWVQILPSSQWRIAEYATLKHDCRSSGHGTPKYALLVYWLFWALGIWRTANEGRGFLCMPLLCLKIDCPEGTWLP